MRRVIALYRSSVGKKAMMAVSGALFVLYVLAHMFGNLKAFQGPEKLDHYAEWLREAGAPLLGHGQVLLLARVVLIAAVIIHVLMAWQLTRLSWAARPVKYRNAPHLEISYASRTMRWGGVILFMFVFFHIMHFTTGNAHPDFVAGSVYRNLVIGFGQWPVAVAYIVALGALALHLYHGIWSGLQTLGANHPDYNGLRRAIAFVIAGVVFFGFISVPVAVMTGVIQ
jgi:succinate dehydrogenase / fumarate reductase cytochrome b subunit